MAYESSTKNQAAKAGAGCDNGFWIGGTLVAGTLALSAGVDRFTRTEPEPAAAANGG